MFLPAKVLTDVKSEILVTIHCFQGVTVQLVSGVSPETMVYR